MRISFPYTFFVAAGALVAITDIATAQQAGQEPLPKPGLEALQQPAPPPAPQASSDFAADTLSDGTVVPNRPTPAKLQLSDAQRAQIRAAVNTRSSEIDFPLGTAEAAKAFQPALGMGVPATMDGQTLPIALTDLIPALKDYVYLKFSDQAVIVDPMSRKVAAIVALP
jgi:hypothetical protein